jgi:hypothetical protein
MPSSRPSTQIHEKLYIKYLMSGNCLILLKYKTWQGFGGRSPPEVEAFFWLINYSNSSHFGAYLLPTFQSQNLVPEHAHIHVAINIKGLKRGNFNSAQH